MHISSQGVETRLQEILDLLVSIRQTQQDLIAREDEKFQQSSAQCAADQLNLSQSIAQKDQKLSDYITERSFLKDEQVEKKSALKEEEDNYESMSADLEQASSDLEAENVDFAQKQGDYQSLIAACDAGVKLLNSMIHGEDHTLYGARNGASFVQLGQVKDKINNIVGNFSQHSSVALLQPVINALAQVSASTSINYEQFLQCIELLVDIGGRLRQDLLLLTNRHDQIVSDLNALIQSLTDGISISSTIIAIYSERLEEISNRLGELDGLISEIQTLLGQLNNTYDQTVAECNAQEEAYQQISEKRAGELVIMNRLIEYFENEVQPTVSNVRDNAIDF